MTLDLFSTVPSVSSVIFLVGTIAFDEIYEKNISYMPSHFGFWVWYPTPVPSLLGSDYS